MATLQERFARQNYIIYKIQSKLYGDIKQFMNIVYLLTNTSKQSGTRFYIGSKTECSLITLDGVPTIISLKDKQFQLFN